MHFIISFVTAIMVLFPASDSGGVSLYQRWMDAYEKYLYQKMYDNLERERNEQKASKKEVQEAVRGDAGRNAGEYSEGDRSICGSGLGGNNGQGCGSGKQDNGKGDRAYSELGGSSAGRDGLTNEQTTSEEVAEEPPGAGAGGDMVQHTAEETFEDVESVETNVQNSEDPPMAAEAEMAEGNGQTPLYSVDGYIPDEGLQTYLYQRLCEAGIGWFHPYAICLIAQESTWNPMAENRNGLDKGLLQYRISYWPTLEWWNPYAEVDVFVAQMANRANSGKTVSEMISAHNQSDYGLYCQSYVDAVMQHSNTLARIR